MRSSKFQMLYCDVGGVLGTNGWDASLRKKIAARYKVDLEPIEARHHLVFDSYERGHMSFEGYLRHVFFGEARDFTVEELRDYAYDQSVPWPENMEFFRKVKESNGLKMALISNEGGGLTEHRVEKFRLRELADFMIFSYFVGYRKPDHEIWCLALNLAQVTPSESIYVDDRKMFVDIAAKMGFTAVHHVSVENTSERLRQAGLES